MYEIHFVCFGRETLTVRRGLRSLRDAQIELEALTHGQGRIRLGEFKIAKVVYEYV